MAFEMRKRGDIKKKTLLEAHVITSALLLFAILSIYYFVFEYEMKEQIQTRLIGIAKLGALLIDADEHNRIRTRGDEQSISYKKVQATLQTLKQANSDIRFIYTTRKTDDHAYWEIVVDAEDSKSEDFSHVGDRYNVSGSELDQLRKSYEQPIADESFITDEWGTFLSGYAPIKDTTGTTVAVVAVDLSAGMVAKNQRDMMMIAFGIFIFSFGLTSLSAHRRARAVINPINKIKEATQQILNGNLDYRLDISSNDQFEDIAYALNKTADSLVSYQRNLEKNLNILNEQKKQVQQQLEFQQLISSISKRYLDTSKFNENTDYTLAVLGQACGADCYYLVLISEDETKLGYSNEWCAEGIELQIGKFQNLPVKMFPWWMKKLRDDEYIYIENIADMPSEALAEKEILESQDINSVLVFPVFTGERLAGFFGYGNVSSSKKCNLRYNTLLSITTEIIGNALERSIAMKEIMNKNLVMQTELELAAAVQLELLPCKSIEIPKVNFAWEFRPSIYVGGDMFNFFKLDEDRIGIYIFDVKGHGVSAALQAVSLSYLIKVSINPFSCTNGKISEGSIYKPSHIIEYLNDRFCHESKKYFFTMFYGILDIKSFILTYSIAGHYPPVIVSKDEKTDFLNYGGPAAGLFDNFNYTDHEVQLKSGDKLIMYTDGIIEAQADNEQFFGLEKFTGIIESNRSKTVSEIIYLTLEELYRHSNESQINDDITILGLEIS